mmetsp:Transcript_6651/g.14365  ORF Transcript_6651/g.14365 Transcript_6651/m.14365 type:complete len:207 (+) Transcript_6651:54-674(+)|eukprot:CAMPEP_0204270168 /NCGR_PEP_ID=MMETSP0468-20130131/18365_1 /ASSEMBLY_ACC=CAM_ASM_000383 /TAXON_ID=2969 /ORGANISM="Oxyrrhis marina" /LENGTH=206 /DNA_ID=CAMNT_0051245665 /DNA_START=52 /DNA_END=672 /DNA_ORIENTATION=+
MGGIMEYNGGAVVAMAGDHCVGIASDHRLGIRQLTTVAMNFGKTFQLTDKCYIGLAGLATDVQTFSELMNFKIKLFNLREERSMPTPMVKAMVGSSLYEKRFGPWLVEPVLAGLDHDNNPILSSYDFIGAATNAKDFVVAGTAGDGLCGACESFWKPNMSPDELFETLAQCLLSGTDRDCLSGWGGTVTIICPDKIITRTLKGRMD